MQKLHKYKKAAYPIVLLLACIIFVSSSMIVYAADGFSKHNSDFMMINDSIHASADETYPYSEAGRDGLTVNKVGFDILYGSTRDLILYFGEVPYRETTEDDGDRIDLFKGYYAYPETSLFQSFTIDGKTVDQEAYWGTGIDIASTDSLSLEALEQVNDSSVVSLRLYALSCSSSAFEHAFGNLWYIIQTGLGGLVIKILGLIVMGKNIDMPIILEMLRMDELEEFVTKAFIWDSDTGSLSVFAGICILLFMFSVVGLVISYVRGTSRNLGFKDLLVWVGVGLLIVGAALSGRITDLGSICSTAVSEITYVIAGAATSGTGSDIFITDINDPGNENKIVQMQEMSLINKCFIDMQLCTQFRVHHVNTLDMTDLGDTDYSKAYADLVGIDDSLDLEANFGGNLGYYFWFADSSATWKTDKNVDFPSTNPTIADGKVRSMITWMQDTYNDGTDVQKETLRQMMYGLAHPDSGMGGLRMMLFTAILIVMCLCLWRYAKDVLLAKIQMIIALLGLVVAGPLMITGKEKLVNTGRDLIALIMVGFVEITVYSLIFDAIIFAVSIIIGPEFEKLFVVLILLLLLWKFNKAINEKVHEATQRMESSFMSRDGVVSNLKNKANTSLRNAPHKLLERASSKYFDGEDNIYDEEGNIIGTKDRHGNKLGMMLQAATDATADSRSSKGIAKITAESVKANRQNALDEKKAISEDAQARVNDAEKEVADEVEEKKRDFQNIVDDVKKEVENDTGSYTQEERQLTAQVEEAEKKMEELTKELITYKKLESAAMQSFENSPQTEDDMKALNDLKTEYDDKQKALEDGIAKMKFASKKTKDKLDMSIATRASTKAVELAIVNGTITEDDAKSIEENNDIKTGLTLSTQEKYKDKLSEALRHQIDVSDKLSNEKTKADYKVNGKKGINIDAINDASVARLKQAELEAGVVMSSTEEAKELMSTTSEAVAQNMEFNLMHHEGLSNSMQTIAEAKSEEKDNAYKNAANDWVNEDNVQNKGARIALKTVLTPAGAVVGKTKQVAKDAQITAKEVKGAAGVVGHGAASAVKETVKAVARKADTVNVAKENAAAAQSTINSIIKQKKSEEKAVAPSQEDIKATINARKAAHKASKTDVSKETYVRDENVLTSQKVKDEMFKREPEPVAKPQVQPQTQRSTDPHEAPQTGADNDDF